METLRNFLSYALYETEGENEEMEVEKSIETIAKQISDRIRRAGKKVVNFVGRSDFKVDIAITDERNPDKYKLGIIIDGKNYFALPSSRDREIVVPSVLKGLGWELHRVWAIDWLNEPDKVMEGIFSHLANIT